MGAGVNMLYAGLKFTGLALNVAGDLAKTVRQDAERMMKEMEADAAAKVNIQHRFTCAYAFLTACCSEDDVYLLCSFYSCTLGLWSSCSIADLFKSW